MMPTRMLGRQGLEVSAIGLGCMGMSQSYGTPDDAESIATIHRALELGITYFDTAEVYGPYANETLLGRALKGRRHEAVVATKFGFRIVDGKLAGLDSSPGSIRSVVDASLRRLAVDHIDLLYQHRIDPAVPVEEVAGTVGRLVEAGKVRFFGLSEAGVGNIRRAHAVHPVSVLQSEYSLWERNLEADILPLLDELGIGLTPFAPLGRGFLTGTAKRADDYPEGDFRRTDPRYQAGHYEQNMSVAERIAAIAGPTGMTPGQIALAWILAKGEHIAPIPGTKRRSFLEENAAAASVRLSPEAVAELDRAAPPGSIAGPRYTEAHMAAVDR